MTMPIIGMLLYNNYYSIHTVREQVADSYDKTLNMYMSQIDSDLNDVDAYLASIIWEGHDLNSLNGAKSYDDYIMEKISLNGKLAGDIALYDSLSAFFVYVGAREDYMDISLERDIPFAKREGIQSYIVDLIHSNQIPKAVSTQRWMSVQIEQDDYIIDMFQRDGVVIGGIINIDRLLEPLKLLQIGNEGTSLFADKHGEPITNAKVILDNGIDLSKNLNDYYLSGADKKFLVVGATSKMGDFNLITLIPDQRILANLPYLQGIIWVITFISLIFIPVGLYFMRQTILIPLQRLLKSMKKVRNGDWNSRVMLYDTSDEFVMLGQSFNSMMDEIQSLRTNVYE
ncbi:sensor histidine kinase, partial [Paenibacillus sp. MCAF20]